VDIASNLSFLREKRVPDLILKSGNEVAAAFLRWLYEADGSVFGKGRGSRAISLKAKEIELLRDVQILLLRFGIHSRIVTNALLIRRGEDIIKFHQRIGFVSRKKRSILTELAAAAADFRRLHGQRSERIVRIIKHEPQDVYDIEVPQGHRFIANGIISHNTAKSQLLQYVSRTAPRGLYTSGRGTTAAGLTAAVVREKSGGMVLEAGALVLADKGVACMTPDTEVYVGDRVVTVGQLWEETDRCQILPNGQEVKPLFCPVASYFGEERIDTKSYTRKITRRRHEGKVLRIEFKSGLSLKVTPEHLVRSDRSSKRLWIPAGQLKVGELVKAPKRLFPPLISLAVGDKTAYTLGFIYGDGYVTTGGVTIAQSRNNESILTNVQQVSPFALSRYDSKDKVKTFGNYVLVERLSRLWSGNRELRELYHSTIGRSIGTILQLSDTELAAFFAGLLDSDGNLNFTGGSLTCVRLFPTSNEHHLSVFLHALRRLGIRGSIRRSKRNPNVHTIQISGISMTRFLQLVMPWSVKAKPAMDKPVKHKEPRLQLDEEQIASIQEIDYNGYVYDLCVSDYHNFAAAGVYIHNCIDEIDKMRPEDRVAIHEALEQHTVSVAKGGIVATLNARAAVLAAANPSLGRYDSYRNITDNINLPVTLLSRFDLLFIMKDVPEADADSKMSEHILTLHRLKMTPEEPPLSPELLRKYVAYAKRVEPQLTEEVVVELRQFYLKMRSTSGSTESPVAITPRQLEALVRLSEARARSFLRDRVEVEDARAIIRLMMLSLEDVGIDTATNKIDIDVIMTGKPKSLRDKMQVVLSTFAELEKQLGIVQDSTLYQALSRKVDITDEEARKLVDQLVREGIIYSPKEGYLKRTAA
jgi:intein/homing endonuclease/MoxR-like ATPase